VRLEERENIMKYKFLLIFGLVLFIGVAIGHSKESTKQLPADAVSAEVDFPAVGTRLTSKIVEKKETYTVTTTVIEDGTYEGRQVHRVKFQDQDKIQIFDKETRNYIGLIKDGELIWHAKPHDGIFQWPLYVGKQYKSKWYLRKKRGNNFHVESFVNVKSYEKITVPAGTFEAFKITVKSKNAKVTKWYCPKLKWYVKSISKHSRFGTKTRELTVYEAP